MEQGRDLAQMLGAGSRVVLMRGHGFAAAGTTLHDVVRISVYLPKNARVQTKAIQLGGFRPLSDGETAKLMSTESGSSNSLRAWEYWVTRCGCAEMLAGHPAAVLSVRPGTL